MERVSDEANAVSHSDSLVIAVVPTLLFALLTVLVEPPWSSIDDSFWGYSLLTAAHFMPLFIILVPSARRGGLRQWMSVTVMSIAGAFLCVHAGVSELIVRQLDAGDIWSISTFLPMLEIFIGACAVPSGLLMASRLRVTNRYFLLGMPALFAGGSQLLWFGIQRLWLGPNGLEFWFPSRIIVHVAVGVTAGFFSWNFRSFRPKPYPFHWGGTTELIISRLPSALPLSVLLGLAVALSGTARLVAEQTERGRWITTRLDDYFLSLTNLRRAEQVGLVYGDLYVELDRKRRALLGAASYDGELNRLSRKMLDAIEIKDAANKGKVSFRNRVMAVNRRLLATGEPFFLEPHAIGAKTAKVRFLFRYKIVRRGRYGLEDGPTVPMLRLRRMDDILVDTPYTGLTHGGIGTVLMDHIDDTAVRTYGTLLSKKALNRNSDEGRFRETALLVRKHRRRALVKALVAAGYSEGTMERLALISEDVQPMIDLSHVRERMTPTLVAAYDHLCEILARQTEIHEARHALDNEEWESLKELEELSVGALSSQTISEIRAYLTEMIDGPLGPKFALGTVGRMIIGENARANAYFFAALVILEGLWGERVRRPDLVEKESEKPDDEPRYVFLPITSKHPGWLSYSRIYGAYADLDALQPDELKQRAKALFEKFFREDYVSVVRLR